ncbi:MAG: VanZ family protein [Polaromonas sp.]
MPPQTSAVTSSTCLLSRRRAWSLFALLVLALLVGTQMPGAWRSGVEHRMHAPFALSSLAHFVVFSAMALVLAGRPISWPAWRVLLATLALGLLTEGLQFFAIDRHPRLIDVGIDMSGALLALAFVKSRAVRR